MSGRYWILTIPQQDYTPYPNVNVQWIKGQLEQGESGYIHWQIVIAFAATARLSKVKSIFGNSTHAELCRSSAADAYVWKDATAIDNTRFEFGEKLLKRNSKRDWQAIWDAAKANEIESIDVAARVQHYRTLRQISADYAVPVAQERTINVFWGVTGTGKSRRAWEEAGLDAYPKDPRTKFWCGYQQQEHVVIDEFRGGIDIGHMLRWLDRYPVIIETKGSSTVLRATTIWITSNLDPRKWYAECDNGTIDALLRRLTITHFPGPIM